MRVPIFVLALGLAASPLAAQSGTATYEVTFHSTWSLATHPTAFPDGGHFSPLVGGVHDETVRFWQSGDIASSGIEQMAERGRTRPLESEVESAIAADLAREVILGGPLPLSPGTVKTTFTVSRDFPLVTLVTMVAPSPDWFVGVDSPKVARCQPKSQALSPVGVTHASPGSGGCDRFERRRLPRTAGDG